MPSFNQRQLNYKALNGNAVEIMLGDIPVAFAQTSAQNIDFGSDALFGIGSAKPQEIQQLRFLPSITIDTFTLTDQGFAAVGYPTVISSILANNQFDIHVLESDGTVLMTFAGAVAQTFNQNIPTNAIVTEALAFLAMDVLDNTGQSILNSNSALNNINQLIAIGAGLNTAGI